MNKLVDYEIVGYNLKRIMKEKNVKGKDLIKKVGCHNSQITDIIHNNYSPRLITLFEISAALDIDICELFKPRRD